ncbi:hypothetical protein [Streptomyces sp. CBMA29]|uniref:hypothetical protein n=1 Tax=Streptomyces sp. CBMA29 TaxID=1896314 RepID=UPI001661B7C0|nr:hypothetical protein [Streptomyces sp. CBMA29]MBD0733984.1 hypothetical protein [Streptomyces sp. CBMA29]
MDDEETADSIIDEALEAAYAKGTHYTAATVREMAAKDGSGNNVRKRAVVDLGVGDSVDRFDSTKGRKIYGPASVEIIFWPDGGIDQRVHEIGEAPAMSKKGFDGRYIPPGTYKGRKKGDFWDKTEYEWDGVSQPLGEWFNDARRHPSVTALLLRTRVKQSGWSIEQALTTPKAPRKGK